MTNGVAIRRCIGLVRWVRDQNLIALLFPVRHSISPSTVTTEVRFDDLPFLFERPQTNQCVTVGAGKLKDFLFGSIQCRRTGICRQGKL